MRIGVLCSGGDAPGMNACLRAVVRTAIVAGHKVIGIRVGYRGILNEDFFLDPGGEPRMSMRSVSNIQQAGGTILHTSRSEQFRTEEGLARAAENLHKNRIDALILIGGMERSVAPSNWPTTGAEKSSVALAQSIMI